MKKGELNQLSWGQRFALVDHYKLDDNRACQEFGVNSKEYEVAKNLRTQNVYPKDDTFDVTKFADHFNPQATPAKAAKKSVTTHVRPDGQAPKKRGRKGDKILKAFRAITSTKVNAEQFAKQHGVSLAVLRQGLRFDKTGIAGKVRVKKDNGVLMVWREKSDE